MRKTIYALTALLVVQAALAVGMTLSSRGLAGQPALTRLLDFPAADVKRLAITDGDGKTVTLAKGDGGWTLPDAGDFPADSGKIKSVLADLAKAREGAPVATSSDAPKRFRVATGAFERRLVFGPAKSPLATLYLGKAQGARQVYVRRADQSGVRLIDFASYRAPATADGWIDRTVLKLDPAKITALAWGDVKITRAPAAAAATQSPATKTATKSAAKTADAKTADAKGAPPPASPSWLLARAGGPAQPVAAAAVTALTDQLGRLEITGIAAAKAGPAAAGSPAKLDLTVSLDGGTSRHYRVLKGATGYLVAAANLPRTVNLPDFTAKALLKAAGNAAFAAPVPPPAAAPAAAPVPAPAPAPAPAAAVGGG